MIFGDPQSEIRRQRRRVALHHLSFERPDRLDAAHRIGIVGLAEIEVVDAEGLHVFVVVLMRRERDHRVGIMKHEMTADHVGAVRQSLRKAVAGTFEQQGSGVDGPAGEDDDIGGKGLQSRLVRPRFRHFGLDAGNLGAGGIDPYVRYFRAGSQRDIGEIHHRPNAVDIRIGFGVDQARESVAGIATNAGAAQTIRLVQSQSERYRIGFVSQAGDAVLDLLHAGLIRNRRKRIFCAAGWVCGIDSALSVHAVQLLRTGIVRLKHVVLHRPFRGDASLVLQRLEVLDAQAKHGRAVNLGIAAHPVAGPRMQRFAVMVRPCLCRMVAIIEKDGRRVPVFLFSRKERPPLQDQQLFS